jgi:hypothetical protein
MNSPEFKNRYGSFAKSYLEGSTVQNARTAMAEFNITAMELGKTTLPAINGGLKDFKAMLETIRSVLPGATKPGAGAKIGTRAFEGALAGGLWGAFGGPGGALGGAIGGGIVGGALGVAEQYVDSQQKPAKGPLATGLMGSVAALAQYAQTTNQAVLGALNALKGDGKHETAGARYERRMAEHRAAAGGAPQAKLAPLALTINLDGKTLAQAMSQSWYAFPTQAPAADGSSQFFSGDHNTTDK